MLVLARKNNTPVNVWTAMTLPAFYNWLATDLELEKELDAARERMKRK